MTLALRSVAPHDIRIIGDPVLKKRARTVADVDPTLVRLAAEMIETMYEASGIGLAAPQIGVGKRLFVWDVGDGARTIVNPEIVESTANGPSKRVACPYPGCPGTWCGPSRFTSWAGISTATR